MLDALHRVGGNRLSCQIQAEELLVVPTQKADLLGPVVIIIDTIDDSGTDDSNAKEPNRRTLISTIIAKFPRFPSSIKVILTSRDEHCIAKLFRHFHRLI